MATKNKEIRVILIKSISRFFKGLLVIPDGACRFYPTCTQYASEAVEKYPLYKAVCLIIWRIIRCNPFSKGGYDPIK